MSTQAAKIKATVEDLYKVPDDGKAEIIHGTIRRMSPTGDFPNRAAGTVYVHLRLYEETQQRGRAYTDNAGFMVKLPNRDSFSPDAAFYTGPRTGGNFLDGAPVFAVEVRSKNDYGPKAEQQIIDKIRDYFAAGTLVVWDVDVLRKGVVRVYRAADPDHPTLYRRGETAEAEPALPGWTLAVDELFS